MIPADRRDPVVQTRVEVRLFCPAELRRQTPERPPVPGDAELHASPSGAAWLAAELGWGSALALILRDAAAACAARQGGHE